MDVDPRIVWLRCFPSLAHLAASIGPNLDTPQPLQSMPLKSVSPVVHPPDLETYFLLPLGVDNTGIASIGSAASIFRLVVRVTKDPGLSCWTSRTSSINLVFP